MQLATKTWVITGAGSGMGRELTIQLLQKGVHVAGVDIHQGTLKAEATASQSSMTLPAPKAAGIIIRAIEKNKFRVMVGRDAALLDKLYRLNPRMATNFIGKMMKKTLANMK